MPFPDIGSKPLEDDFQGILDAYGHYAVYVRVDRRIRCATCYRPDTDEGDNRCPACLGLGYQIRLEKALCRISDTETRGGRGQLTVETAPIGPLGPGTSVFYLQDRVWPRVGDLLCDVVWTVPTESVLAAGRVRQLLGIYRVSHVISYRFDQGNVAYHAAYVQQREADQEWFAECLARAVFTPFGKGAIPAGVGAPAYTGYTPTELAARGYAAWSDLVIGEKPTPDPDGATTTFYTARSYRSGTLLVYLNGVRLFATGSTPDYTEVLPNSFTLESAPLATHELSVEYIKA